MKIPIMQSFIGSLALLATDMIFGSMIIGRWFSIDIAHNIFAYGLALLFIASICARFSTP